MKQKGYHATSEHDAQSMQDILYLLREKRRDGDDAIAGAALERAKEASGPFGASPLQGRKGRTQPSG